MMTHVLRMKFWFDRNTDNLIVFAMISLVFAAGMAFAAILIMEI